MMGENTIEKILERARLAMGSTPEERAAAMEKRTREFDAKQPKIICDECHCQLDSIYYTGHSFRCSRRGTGL